MKEYNINNKRRYVKICKDSGCVSADYSMEKVDEDTMVITYENNELSGSFVNLEAKKDK
jgi:hypothetical protein